MNSGGNGGGGSASKKKQGNLFSFFANKKNKKSTAPASSSSLKPSSSPRADAAASSSFATSSSAAGRSRTRAADPIGDSLYVGRRIAVYWPDDDEYYPALIRGISRTSSTTCTLRYDDGDVEAIDLKREKYISASFSAHQSLRILRGDPIGDVGAISIGSLLAVNKSLADFHVLSSNIGECGLQAIARGIAQNRTLEWLDLSGSEEGFIARIQNACKRALYNDESMDAVLTGSNHTLKCISPRGDVDLRLLLAMNGDGPDEARRRKLIRFLDENPGSLLSVGVNDTLLPRAIEKIGRVGRLDAMHIMVRDVPDMFEKKDVS